MKISRIGSALLFVVIVAFLSHAQDKPRRIEQPTKFTYANTPVRVEIMFDSKDIVGKEVLAGPDWIHKLQIVTTNTSGKDISTIWFNLTIREGIPNLASPPPGSEGVMIPVQLRPSNGETLLAGRSVTLSPSKEAVDFWINHVKAQGINEIEKLILDIKQIGFTDGTVWNRGRLTRKDPKTGRFVKLSFNRNSKSFNFLDLFQESNIERVFFYPNYQIAHRRWKATLADASGC